MEMMAVMATCGDVVMCVHKSIMHLVCVETKHYSMIATPGAVGLAVNGTVLYRWQYALKSQKSSVYEKAVMNLATITQMTEAEV